LLFQNKATTTTQEITTTNNNMTTMEASFVDQREKSSPKKGGFLSRFRKSNKSHDKRSSEAAHVTPEKRDLFVQHSQKPELSTRDGVPSSIGNTNGTSFQPSGFGGGHAHAQRGGAVRGQPISSNNSPPPAREAAFSGPPRFDWIDVVS
jgi:hypothetical protein